MESILTSVKKMLGIAEEYEHFDPDIIMHINTVFSILTQLGAGTWFSISDKTAVWSDFIADRSCLELIKSYMFLKVRLLFDPPVSSAVSEAVSRQISELEWRISVTVDPSDNGFDSSDDKSIIDDENVSNETTYSSEKIEEDFIDNEELDNALSDRMGIIYSPDVPPKHAESDTWFEIDSPQNGAAASLYSVREENMVIPRKKSRAVDTAKKKSVIDDSSVSKDTTYSSEKIEDDFIDNNELDKALDSYSGIAYSAELPKYSTATSLFKIERKEEDQDVS